MKSAHVSRRRFLLTGSGILMVGFLPGCSLPIIPKRPQPELADAMGWVRYDGLGYQLIVPRVEMGQNIVTSLKQIACDELGIRWQQLEAKLHTTQSISRVRATVGSDSIKDFSRPLAQACAALREGIQLGLSQSQLKGLAQDGLPLRSIGAASRIENQFIGRSPQIEQGRDIVMGKPLFAADVRRPGMLYGRVLRANASPELSSTIKQMNEQAAQQQKGFVAIVKDDWLGLGLSQGIGIVAQTPAALDRIAQALAIEWVINEPQSNLNAEQLVDIDARLKQTNSRTKTIYNDTIDVNAQWDIDLRIDIPLAAHASIQPRACVAEFGQDNSIEMWVSSQDVFYQRDVIAKRLGLDLEKVVVHGMRVGGAFGGKTICTVELEAALLARAVKGVVKVQWSRAQEFQFGFHRPPSSHRIRVRLANAAIDQWWHSFASSHILFTNAVVPPWIQKITNFIGDDGVARGAQLPYKAKAKRTEFDLVRVPAYTGPWRGLGAGPNVFAIESAVDECAIKLKIDPVQFRLAQLDDVRLKRTLDAVAKLSNWPRTVSAASGKRVGFGVACGIYKAMSYAAVVAQVEVDELSGAARVIQMWCTHDCGQVINPDQVKAQCEGNLVWGLGMVFTDGLSNNALGVQATSFAQSPIPVLRDIPKITITLVDNGEPAGGAGETAIVASGAAIANAIRHATGHRIAQLPVKPETLRSVMQKVNA